MKDKEEILLEFKIGDILIELIKDQADNNIYNEMTTSDLQGMTTVKAMEIIKLVRGKKEITETHKAGISYKTVIGKSCRDCKYWIKEKHKGFCNECYGTGNKDYFVDVHKVGNNE